MVKEYLSIFDVCGNRIISFRLIGSLKDATINRVDQTLAFYNRELAKHEKAVIEFIVEGE